MPTKTEAPAELKIPDANPTSKTNDTADPKDAEPTPQAEKIDHQEAMALLNSVEYSTDGLKSMFKTEGHLSDLEYEALVLAIGRCTPNPAYPDEYSIELCPPFTVNREIFFKNLNKDYPDNKNEVLTKVLKGEGSHNPVLRSFIYREYQLSPKGGNFWDVDKENMKSFVQFAKDEKDDLALLYATAALAMNDGLYQSPEAVDFVLETLAKHPNPLIRKKVAAGMLASRYQNVDGDRVKKAFLDLCNDKDPAVRGAACQKIFDFQVDNAEKLAMDYLKDPGRAESHGVLLEHFLQKAFNPDNPDENAYRVVMDYLKSTPRTRDFPNSGAILALSDLPFESKKDADFVKWTKKAPFYVEKDMIEALKGLVLDSALSDEARKFAGGALMSFSSKNDVKAMIQTLKSAKDPKNDDVIEGLKYLLE